MLTDTIQMKKVIFSDIDYKDIMFYYFALLVSFSIVMVVISSLVVPSYLLMGSFSIDQFSQSNVGNDIMTFTIKETGMPYSANYIDLYEINASDKEIFERVDNIIINNTNPNFSRNNTIFGKIYEGVWYLNVNTSKLRPATYLLHAEVTNDLTKKFIFGTIKKHDEKLFYIAPKNANYSLNST